MLIGALVKRMPGRIEVVVAAGQARVQRSALVGLLVVDRRIVVAVIAFEGHAATANDQEVIDERHFADGESGVHGEQRLGGKADVLGRGLWPALRRPARGCRRGRQHRDQQ